ncbi:hypothetical protein CRUP_012884 [Coryphaenoides rupestris]|nr:hypothetical protein CRUP_012884 [Coryphaenoides rupestris]
MTSFPGKSHSGGQGDPVLQYVVANSLRQHPVLAKLKQRTLEDKGMVMLVATEQAQFMGNLVKLIQARKTLEVGMYTGYNTLNMALSVPEDGRVVACELERAYVDIARPFFKEAGVDDELIAAGEAGTFDFIFIDADKNNYDGYYERSLQLVRRGGIIAIDNVLWSGRVVNPAADDLISQTLDALNKKLHKDERIDLSMLTIGDGLTLAFKR